MSIENTHYLITEFFSMENGSDFFEHNVRARCTAGFGSEGQICTGDCALQRVVKELDAARRVYISRGASVRTETPRVIGLCRSIALHKIAGIGPLPSIGRLTRMGCGGRAQAKLIVRRGPKNQQYG